MEKKQAIDARWTTVHRGPPGPPRLAPVVTRCRYASAGMQLGYKSVLFILHFHLAGMNRGEPGRTVAPPWRTGKNRSVTGVLPAWTWVNRGEPAREPG